MLTPTREILDSARAGCYAVGAFNIYNLEGALAVQRGAEAENSAALLQLHPKALSFGGPALIALCKQVAAEARVPIGLHLDHCVSLEAMQTALDAGLRSVMIDGSHLSYEQNVALTQEAAQRVHALGGVLEAELGRLSGSEDGLTIEEREARLTDPAQARDFIERTGADWLAVCIGNVHGNYPGEVRFDFERLAAIRAAVAVPLVLHGASGVPAPFIRRAIELGVVKFNVNTDLRGAYLHTLHTSAQADLVGILEEAVASMTQVVREKIRAFRLTD